jgi:hypothetical protein
MWQREDHMKIRHGQYLSGTRRKPLVTRIGLTLRAMPVSTRAQLPALPD